MATKEQDPEDVELASYKQLKRIADALESLHEEVALAASALSSLAESGITVYEPVEP